MAERRHPQALVIVIAVVAAAVVLIVTVAIATVALVVPVRSEVTEVPADGQVPPPVEQAEEPPGEALPAASTLSIAEEAAKVAEAIRASDEPWRRYVTRVEVVTWLRRPLIRIETNLGPEQADAADELSSGIVRSKTVHTGADGTEYTYSIQFRSAEGDVIGSVGSTDARWRLTDAPPTPTGAPELTSWLAAVYGPGSPAPEPWHGRITSVRSEPGDPDGYLVVRTDLDPAVAEDSSVAETIIAAVNSSGATFAPGVRVLFGDGVYEWTGMLDGADPFGG